MEGIKRTEAKYELSPDTKLIFHPVAQIDLRRHDVFVDHGYSPDGTMLAIAFATFVWLFAHSGTSETQRRETWALRGVYTLQDQNARITCMNWTSTSLLAFGFNNGFIALMKANSTESILRGFQVSEYPISSIEVDPKAQYMAILAGRGEVGFWSATPHVEEMPYFYLPSIGGQLPLRIRAIQWLGDGDKPTLLVAYEHQGIYQWILDFVEDDATLGTFTATHSPIATGIFSPDGTLFLTPDANNGFMAHGLTAEREPPQKFMAAPNPTYTLGRIPADKTYAKFLFGGEWLVGSSGEKLHLWQVAGRVLACDIALCENGCTAGQITVSGVLRRNTMNNVRIATHISTGSGDQKIMIFKAFPRDEAPGIPIVVTPAPRMRGLHLGVPIIFCSVALLLAASFTQFTWRW